jgi:uncharacterized Zn-binding protein involved in type VI secretion
MSLGIAILNSGSSHGGGMYTASGTGLNTLSGIVCISGDTLDCPIHGINPVETGCSTILVVNGKPAVIQGSVANCGAVINSGFANGILTAS